MHSDRGSQYASEDYRKLLKQFHMTQSMSRKGNCWDNAPQRENQGASDPQVYFGSDFVSILNKHPMTGPTGTSY
jgi:transposase InsO family protein